MNESRHKGRHQHRFKNNPSEKIFAEEWQKLHQNVWGGETSTGILDYLLAEDNNRPCGEVTDRDAEVAATVIQWLGSPVGKNWLEEVLKKVKQVRDDT